MKRKFTKLLAALALLVCIAPPLTGWGQTRSTLTLNSNSGFGSSYQTNHSFSVGEIGFKDSGVMYNSKGTPTGWAVKQLIQMRKSGSGAGEIYNTTQISTISSIKVTLVTANNDFSVYYGNSENPNVNSIASNTMTPEQGTFSYTNTSGGTGSATSYTFLFDLSSYNATFIKILNGSKANYVGSIVINYEESVPTVATPTFTPAGGTYTEAQSVTIACETEGSTIYYTTDGTTPDNNSTPYTGAISVTETTTIKAIAYVGTDASSVATATYTILSLTDIATARAQTEGSTVYTQGVVTSFVGTTGYIQDNEAAICVYGTSLTVGDAITVSGTLSTFNGLLEITSPTVTVLSSGNTVTPETMTIAQINASSNQGWFIKVEGATVGSTSNYNTTLTQNGSSIVARYLSGAEEGDVINLTGNIGCYNTTNQIANPIVLVGPTISVDETDLSFTYVVGETTAPQRTLIVEGTNLEGNVTVSLTGNNFKMSGDDGETWSTNDIVLTPTDGTIEETMIDVMMNTGLQHGTYEGTITLASANANTVTVSLTGSVTNPTYAITLDQPSVGGAIAANKATAEAGETVTLTATPATGYAFGGWTVLKEDLETEVEVNDGQFTMPACDVMVSGSFNQNDYTITLAETTNGTVACEEGTAHYGDEIMVTTTPAQGYRVASFTVTETEGEGTVTDIEVADELYSFSMPAFNITITVTFEVIPETYDGRGTFTKVTALADLEDGGYYVLYGVNGNYNGAMNSTCTSSKMGVTSVTINANDEIVDPAKSIVWKLEKQTVDNADRYYLYNEDAEKYCYISTDNTTGFALSESKPTNGYYTVAVSDGNFSFVGQFGGRMISIYQTDFRCYGSSNAKTLNLYKLGEASIDPYIMVAPASVEVPSVGGSGSLAITFANMTIASEEDFAIQYYDAEENELQETPTWMSNVTVSSNGTDYVVNYTIAQNDDADRTAYFKVYAMSGEDYVYSNMVVFSQDVYVAPRTYTLATAIESGRHYIIVGYKNDTPYAMGTQNNNNRVAVQVSVSQDVATVSSADVYEFVIIGPDVDGYYTIYDVENAAYLYAASSSSNNLKTQAINDNNGRWEIGFTDGVATIKAQGTNSRNLMRYNNTNDLFSCYGSGQQDIYLYAKDNETYASETKTINGYSDVNVKDGYYLIASPFGQVTPTSDNHFLANDYDLYAFNQKQDKEWINYEAGAFNLVSGRGYLYANSGNVELQFQGLPYVGNGQVFLAYDEDASFAGWNLVGNPWPATATVDKPFYTMNEDGDGFIAKESGETVNAMEGIFVRCGLQRDAFLRPDRRHRHHLLR